MAPVLAHRTPLALRIQRLTPRLPGGQCGSEMTRAKRQPEANDDQTERLITAVHDLADQIEVLRDVLDEIRVDFRHAIFTDKLRCPSASSEQPAESTPEPDDDDREAIHEVLEDGGNLHMGTPARALSVSPVQKWLTSTGSSVGTSARVIS